MTPKPGWGLATACLALALFTGPASAASDDDALIAKGKDLLNANCSRCHAIGKTGSSPHEKAPPFRDVMKRYPAEDLSESLAEGIMSGHPDMPEFTFEPDQIDAIIAYLDGLREDAQ